MLTCTNEFLGAFGRQLLLERALNLLFDLLFVGGPLLLDLCIPLLLLLLALPLGAVLLAACSSLLRARLALVHVLRARSISGVLPTLLGPRLGLGTGLGGPSGRALLLGVLLLLVLRVLPVVVALLSLRLLSATRSLHRI